MEIRKGRGGGAHSFGACPSCLTIDNTSLSICCDGGEGVARETRVWGMSCSVESCQRREGGGQRGEKEAVRDIIAMLPGDVRHLPHEATYNTPKRNILEGRHGGLLH